MERALMVLLLLATPALAQNTGDAARGKELFLRDACYTCHGTTGAGGGALGGPRLAHAGLTQSAIVNALRRPRAAMPAYSQTVLPDSDAADIVAFIQSLSSEPATDAKKIPLLNPR